jgi:hypothetical protein
VFGVLRVIAIVSLKDVYNQYGFYFEKTVEAVCLQNYTALFFWVSVGR